MRHIRFMISGFRLSSRIVPVLFILTPVLAWGLDDKIVFVSNRSGTPEVYLVEGLDGRPIQLTHNRFASWPSISPDGTEVAFVSRPPGGPSNIFKLHIARDHIEILTDNGEFNVEYSNLDWAPNGRQLLFLKIMDNKTSLCLMNMNTRDIRHILQPNPPTKINYPSWSPDSQHILYAVDHRLPGKLPPRELFITDDNGNLVKNVEQDLTLIESLQRLIVPTWSPRRSQIAYFGLVETNRPHPNPWQIYSMNLDDGMVTAVTSGGAENRFSSGWSPDGRKILVNILSPFDEEVKWSDIHAMDPNGENMINLTQSPEREGSACWSPDGKQIAFSRRLNEGGFAIFAMDADGQNQRRLTFEPGTNIVSHWSPDGDRIAFLSSRDGGRRIYTMDTNGQNVRQITHGQRKYDSAPAWSPDGKWLAYGSGDERGLGIYLVDPQGGNETRIFHSNVSQLDYSALGRPAWSPDSQHLIFVAPWEEAWSEGYAGLTKIRVDGGLPTYLKTKELKQWRNPVWSPDGNILLFSAREERGPIVIVTADAIFLMNLTTSETRHFILPGIRESKWTIFRLVWAPNGSQLMLSIGPIEIKNLGESRLYLIDIASETVRLWMEDAAEADWVRPGFVYAVNPRQKRIATWAQMKTRKDSDAQVMP